MTKVPKKLSEEKILQEGTITIDKDGRMIVTGFALKAGLFELNDEAFRRLSIAYKYQKSLYKNRQEVLLSWKKIP